MKTIFEACTPRAEILSGKLDLSDFAARLKDAEYFNNLFQRFLIHCNRDLKILDKLNKPEDFFKIKLEDQMILRRRIYEKMGYYIESFF